MKRIVLFCLLMVLLTAEVCGQQLSAKRIGTGLGYLEFLPAGYHNSNSRYPLLIFLHGIGEKGDGSPKQLELLKKAGPLKLISEGHDMCFTNGQENDCFIVIAPQLPNEIKGWWPSITTRFIKYILEGPGKYRIDRDRVYLTGLSLGGQGVWEYAYSERGAETLAAIAPVAGWGSVKNVCAVADAGIPVRAYHGKLDKTIPPRTTEQMIRKYNQCDGAQQEAELVMYPKTGHNSWEKAYSTQGKAPNLYHWLLQKKRTPTPGHVPSQFKEINVRNLELVNNIPISLKEVSGLEYAGDSLFWMHNDSGNGPYLFLVHLNGTIESVKRIIGAANFDWEDIAKDEKGDIYIADIGNNNNKRKELQVYKIKGDSLIQQERPKASTIRFFYPLQTSYPPEKPGMIYDSEAMVVLQDSIYIFNKNRSVPFDGYIKLYKIPTTEGLHPAQLMDSLYVGGDYYLNYWITGAAISKDQKNIALLSHDKILLFRNFRGSNFFGGDKYLIRLNHYSQKESICFDDDNNIYVADEVLMDVTGGNIYYVPLQEILEEK